ncbi:unnamed protein product, partial [Oppiella nova]
MWRGEAVSAPKVVVHQPNHKITATSSTTANENQNNNQIQTNQPSVQYIYSPSGLFPAPMGRTTKAGQITKSRQRFKLLGKFVAKALMDSRMIDIPLSPIFYKWLLTQELSLSIADMQQIDSTFSRSVVEMEKIAQQKLKIQSSNAGNKEKSLESLKLHGCSIEDLNLDYTLPGYPNIELRKGGRDMGVSIDNIEQYVRLLCHWTLVE